MLRILLVDDRKEVRCNLALLLNLQPGIEVIGEAADGWDALSETDRLKPDLVIMDLRMPGLDGLAATRKIKRNFAGTEVIILSMYDDSRNRAGAIEAGAFELVCKDKAGHLLDSINRLSLLHPN